MTYEKRFLDVRDKLVMRRAELKMKYQQRNLNSAFSNDLCQASAAAESILAQFDDNPPGPSIPSFPSPLSRQNFSNAPLQSYPNYGMLTRNDRRPLPPVLPMLNYTHRKGGNMNMMRMRQQQQQRPSGGPGNIRQMMNKSNNMMQNIPDQGNVFWTSIRVDDKHFEEAQKNECPAKLTNSQIKRFKFLRTKNEDQLNEEEKTYIERYTYISRKRNQYLFEEREKKRQQEELEQQPAPPGLIDLAMGEAMEEV